MAQNHNTYELTYIVNSVISDTQVQDLITRVSGLVTENGGEIIEVDQWGSRRLAFPIMKKRNGFYVNMYFRAPGAIVLRLERALEIDDNVLRYLTMKMDAKMLRHYDHETSIRSTHAPIEEKPKSDSRPGKPGRSGDGAAAAAPAADAPAEDVAATDAPVAVAEEVAAEAVVEAPVVVADAPAEVAEEVVVADVAAEKAGDDSESKNSKAEGADA